MYGYTVKMVLDLNTFWILVEIFLCIILLTSIKIADDWALEAINTVEKEGEKTIDLIKEIKEDLIKLNKILKLIQDFKVSRVKNIIVKAFDIISILMILHPGGTKKFKITKLFTLGFIKSLISILKPV